MTIPSRDITFNQYEICLSRASQAGVLTLLAGLAVLGND
jgi:hypothetical protein